MNHRLPVRVLRNVFVLTIGLVGSIVAGGVQQTAVAQAKDGETWALIVGIDDYAHLPDRAHAVADARAVRNLLIQHFDAVPSRVSLLLGEEASRSNVVAAFSRLRLTAPEDRVFIYLSGRGQTVRRADGRLFGAFATAASTPLERPEDARLSLSATYLKGLLERIPARKVLSLVDAEVGGWEATYPHEGGEASGTEKPVRQVITATRFEEHVVEPKGWRHSAFTYALLSSLRGGRADADGNAAITSTELGTYIRQVVPALTEGQQHPQFRAFTESAGTLQFAVPPKGERVPQMVREAETSSAPEAASASLEVDSYPVGAGVFLDGRKIGETPLQAKDLAPGAATVELISPGYHASQHNLYLHPGQRLSMDVTLEASTGTLSLMGMPSEAKVLLDGHSLPPQQQSYTVSVGEHEATVRWGEETVRKTVRIRPGKEQTLAVRRGVFNPLPVAGSLVFPGAGQFFDGAKIKGGLTAAAVMGLGTYAYLSRRRFDQAEQRFYEAQTAYEEADSEREAVRWREEMTNRHQKVANLSTRYNVTTAVLFGLYGLNLVDVLFFHSRTAEFVSLSSEGDKRLRTHLMPTRRGIRLQVRF